jgi:hypothetical protein
MVATTHNLFPTLISQRFVWLVFLPIIFHSKIVYNLVYLYFKIETILYILTHKKLSLWNE